MTKSNIDDLPDFPLPPDEHNGGAPGDDSDDSGLIESASAKPQDFSDVSIGIRSAAEEFDSSSKRFAKSSDAQATAILGLTSAVSALTASLKSPTAKAVPDPTLTAGLENPRQADATAAAFPTAVVPGITDASAGNPRFEPSIRQADSEPQFNPSIRQADTFQSPSLVSGGEAGKDSVDAKLKPGEFVMRPEAVKAIGVKNLEAANNKLTRAEYRATGGLVGVGQQHFGVGGVVNKAVQSAQLGGAIGEAVGGPYGAAAGAAIAASASVVVDAFDSVTVAATAAASQLGAYNASIASAVAVAAQRQAIGDINRAESVGVAVGANVETNSKFSDSTQDLYSSLLRAGLAVVNPIMELLEPMYKFMIDVLQHALANMMETLSGLARSIGQGKIAENLEQAAADIRKLANKEDEDAGGIDIDQWTNQFLNGHGMGDDANVPAANAGNVFRPGRRPPPGAVDGAMDVMGGMFRNAFGALP